MAGEADLNAVNELRNEFWSDQISKGSIDHPELTGLMADTAGLMRRPRTAIFVALQGDKVVGYILGQTRILPGVAGSIVSSVEEIFALPEWRRSAVARKLVEATLAEFRTAGAQRIQLRVLERNEDAKKFWRTLNFFPSVTIYEYAAK